MTYLCEVKRVTPEKSKNSFGVLYHKTNINVEIHPLENLIKGGGSTGGKKQGKGLFKDGFKASDMGIGGLDEELG